MALTIVGAGLGRTGTASLKAALERLLGAPCYHMWELVEHPEGLDGWERALAGEAVDWGALLGGYAATVDWPAASFWREILAANPGALVLLSTRESPERWWASMERTVVQSLGTPVPPDRPDWARRRALTTTMMRSRFTAAWPDRHAAIAAYEEHNEAVRREVPPARLIDWRPGDGWEPICAALGIAVPSQEFPHENDTASFRRRMDVDDREPR
jgi:hypothetical protein